MQLAVWLYRATPDPNLPGKATPFRLLFSPDNHTEVNAATPTHDGKNLGEFHTFIADRREALYQVQEVCDALHHNALRVIVTR